MRPLLVLLALVVTVAAVPVDAAAGSAAITTVDLTLRSGDTLVPAERDRRFTLVGLHWQGSGSVLFRTRSLEGRWTTWRPAAPEDEDGPDLGSGEERSRTGWRVGNPWWVGPSDRLEMRKVGRVGRVRAHLVWSPAIEVPLRVPALTTESAADRRAPPGRKRSSDAARRPTGRTSGSPLFTTPPGGTTTRELRLPRS
jgi:hypothetical protein